MRGVKRQLNRLDSTARNALMEAAQDAPKQTAEQRLELLRTFRIDEGKLQKVTQPVLLIGSQEDHLLPSVDEAHQLAKIFPNAQVVALPHSGHACLVESDVFLIRILQNANFLLA